MSTPTPHAAPRFARPPLDLVSVLSQQVADQLADEVFEALVAGATVPAQRAGGVQEDRRSA